MSPRQPSRAASDADLPRQIARAHPASGYHPGVTAANLEIERKFRLRGAPSAADLAAHDAVPLQLEQVYLANPDPGVAERVRRTTTADGRVTYRHTVKRRVAAFSFDERETVITEADWIDALRRADPLRDPGDLLTGRVGIDDGELRGRRSAVEHEHIHQQSCCWRPARHCRRNPA